MKLFFRESGQGQPLIVLHGLFGSSDNWYTVGKQFAVNYRVLMVDQRNHGQSPHSEEFNYRVLTEDLFEFVKDHGLVNPIILGHSLGGKTAMNFAVRYPGSLGKLIVVDIIPKPYPAHHDHILEGLTTMPVSQLSNRTEAETYLMRFVPDPSERQFLLKNLSRKPSGGFEWKVNVEAIDRHIEEVGEGMQYPGSFEGPSLFIVGGRSSYYAPGDEAAISRIFPAARLVTLDTGHWVQAEKPAEFVSTVLNFLGQ